MSADIQFNMRLEQDDYEKIEKIRKRIGLSSKKQAVVYLINYYMDREKFTNYRQHEGRIGKLRH